MKKLSLKDQEIIVFSKVTGDKANKILQDRQATYEKTDDGFKCKKCGSLIQQTTLYVSIHHKLFPSCAGSGEVQQVNYPYCPKCEGEPETVRGCVHI